MKKPVFNAIWFYIVLFALISNIIVDFLIKNDSLRSVAADLKYCLYGAAIGVYFYGKRNDRKTEV